MGTFVAWMRAKLMASQSKLNRRGAVLVEYLILTMGVFAVAVAINAYWANLTTEYNELASSVTAITP